MKRQKTKLRDLAPDVPCCMGCLNPNYDRQRLCLAHSNKAEDGRGMGLKSHDIYGAYLCDTCHTYVDNDMRSKSMRSDYHKAAWANTMRWWIENGHVGIIKGEL